MSKSVKPKVFCLSKSHPDYEREELRYIKQHLFFPSRELPSIDDYIQNINQSLGKYPVPEKTVRTVAEAVRDYGNDLLTVYSGFAEILTGGTLSEAITEEARKFASLYPSGLEKLGKFTCAIVLALQYQAFDGMTLDERRKARNGLLSIGKALVPESRGKKKTTTDPIIVRRYYLVCLFQLYHIEHTLRNSQGSRSKKVKSASKNFEMPINKIRDIWKLNENDEPTVRPVPIREMARTLTARHFGITQHRVSNIIAL